MPGDNASVGPFDLLELVGRGGMAEVWKAVHRDDQVLVAIKIITGGPAGNDQFVYNFRHEIRAAAALEHPNIIEVFDFGEIEFKPEQLSTLHQDPAESPSFSLHATVRSASGQPVTFPYMAMEFAESGHLGRECSRFAWSDIQAAIIGILKALAHAHARGVIHLDLKPANVLVCRESDGTRRYKLSDFGISQICTMTPQPWSRATSDPMDAESAPGRIQGTPRYMAPEQFRSDPREFGPWTDLYGIGCLAYALVTGSPPFYGQDYRELARQHLRGKVPQLKPRIPIPAGFEDWIHRLLEKDPPQRFARAAEALWEFQQLADPQAAPFFARAPGVHRQTPPFDRSDISDSEVISLDADVSTRSIVRSSLPSNFPGLGKASEDTGDEVSRTPGAACFAHESRPDLPGQLDFARTAWSSQLERRPRISIPSSWREAEQSCPMRPLRGVGLNLFGLKSVPLQGRSQERDALWSILRQASKERKPHLALLQGAQGVGKSRLAQWTVECAEEWGAAAVFRAPHRRFDDPADGLRWMMAQHFRSIGSDIRSAQNRVRRMMRLLDLTDSHDHNVMIDFITPLCVNSASEIPTSSDSTPSHLTSVHCTAMQEQFSILGRYLQRLAREHLVVIWLDDIHWSHWAIEFATYVLRARGSATLPLVLILTVDCKALEEYQGEQARLGTLLSMPEVHRVLLRNLDDSDQSTLIHELIPLDPELITHVAKTTEGNPLFAVQLLTDWVKSGVLLQGVAGFVVHDTAVHSIPKDLDALWSRRLDLLIAQLTTRWRVALELAAILGQSVNMREWKALCNRRGIEGVEPLLEYLRCVHMVQVLQVRTAEEGLRSEAWHFEHAALHSCLENRIKQAGRWQALHWECVSILRGLYPTGPSGVAPRIAHHLHEAGQFRSAAVTYLRCADEHRRNGDFQQGLLRVASAEESLRCLNPGHNDEMWGECEVLRADLFALTGRVREATVLFNDSIQQGVVRGWKSTLAEARCGLARLMTELGDQAGALTLFEQARCFYEELGLFDRVALCLLRIGASLSDLGEWEGAELYSQQALKRYLALSDLRGQAHAFLALGLLAHQARERDSALNFIRHAMRLYDSVGSRIGVARCLQHLGSMARSSDPTVARRTLKRALELFRILEHPYGEIRCMNELAEVDRVRGNFFQAERGYRRCIRLHRRVDRSANPVLLSNLGLVLLAQQDYTGARSLFRKALKRVLQGGHTICRGSLHAHLLPCAANLRDWNAFDRHLQRARRFLRRASAIETDDAATVNLAAKIADQAGEIDRAHRAYRLAIYLWHRLKNSQEKGEAKQLLTSLSSPESIVSEYPR